MSSEFLQKARFLTGKLIRIESDSPTVAAVSQFLQREANNQQMMALLRKEREQGGPTSEDVAEKARLYEQSLILRTTPPKRTRTVYIAGKKLNRPQR